MFLLKENDYRFQECDKLHLQFPAHLSALEIIVAVGVESEVDE